MMVQVSRINKQLKVNSILNHPFLNKHVLYFLKKLTHGNCEFSPLHTSFIYDMLVDLVTESQMQIHKVYLKRAHEMIRIKSLTESNLGN